MMMLGIINCRFDVLTTFSLSKDSYVLSPCIYPPPPLSCYQYVIMKCWFGVNSNVPRVVWASGSSSIFTRCLMPGRNCFLCKPKILYDCGIVHRCAIMTSSARRCEPHFQAILTPPPSAQTALGLALLWIMI